MSPHTLVRRLPIAQRQLVAIMQVLSMGTRLVILDEPTASLNQAERTIIFDVVKRLSAAGTTFLYISHHLDEIFALCDRATVLRDGKVVSTHITADVTKEAMVQEMVGVALGPARTAHSQNLDGAPTILDITELQTVAELRGCSLTVRIGEVVGLYGAVGSGCSEILKAVFGAVPTTGGEIRYDGNLLFGDTASRVRAGIAYVPEDRRQSALFMDWEIWRNATIANLIPFANSLGGLSTAHERSHALDMIGRLEIRARDCNATVSNLSGGNQQKVVFAKWLKGAYRLFLLDQPTVAVDVLAKEQILGLVRTLASSRNGIIVHSVEPDELLAVCDRILVVRGGRVIAQRTPDETNETELLALAVGAKSEEY